jgi:hypothetical protein
MGMFDKDKEIGRELTSTFAEREEFKLLAVKVDEKAVQTDFGKADKSTLGVQRLDGGEAFEVTSLGGAIANKCKEAAAGDLPAVVCWLTVTSKQFGKDATVLQFIREAK